MEVKTKDQIKADNDLLRGSIDYSEIPRKRWSQEVDALDTEHGINGISVPSEKTDKGMSRQYCM